VLIFGCCAGPTDRFATVASPALERVMGPSDRLIVEEGSEGICRAYNRILDQARRLPECDGVVLLHDDVALEPSARSAIVAALATPGVGVAGVVGGRGLYDAQWVSARRRAGYANDHYGYRRFGPASADVDVVDGLLLCIGRAAFLGLDFDAEGLPAFHGYDTDYCLRVREAGLAVRVEPIAYRHHDKGTFGDEGAFQSAQTFLRDRWPQWIVPLTLPGRLIIDLKEAVTVGAGSLRHRLFTTAKRLLRHR
jgi:GT2 family glycosyltransferase